MSYIYGTDDLPGTKSDARPLTGPANLALTAAEFNQITGILAEAKAAVRAISNLQGVISDAPSAMGAVNVKDSRYGAVGDGITDDTAAIQAAIVACQALGAGRCLYLPPGTYLTSAHLTLSTVSMHIMGSGVRGAKLYANFTGDAAIKMSASQSTYFAFSNFEIQSEHNTNYGIYGAAADHCVLTNLQIRDTKLAGVYLGEGWDNRVVGCDFEYNDLDGLIFAGQNNHGSHVLFNSFLTNGGVGFTSQGGQGGIVAGNVFESNAKLGIYLQRSCVSYLIIGNEFESNSVTTGYAFTLPYAKTVHADIVINGSATATTMYGGQISRGVRVLCNFLGSSNYVSAGVWIMGADGVTLDGNTGVGANAAPLIAIPGTGLSAGVACRNIRIGPDNLGFSKDVLLDNPTSGDVHPLHDLISESYFTVGLDVTPKIKPFVNYVDDDIFKWASQAGTVGTLMRSSVQFGGFEVFEMCGNSSRKFGQTFDVDAHPEIASKLMQFSCWIKSTNGATLGGILLANGYTSIQSVAVNTGWNQFSIPFVAPASGTFTISLELATASNTPSDKCYFSKPTLCQVGVRPDLLWQAPLRKPTWRSSAAPTIGLWNADDIVWLSGVTAGGNIGNVDTSAGAACNTSWVALTVYAIHDQRKNGTKVYECITAGTSAAATGPTTTGSNETDGSVHWRYIADLAIFKTFGAVAA